jgi:hypothetical protein
MFDGDGSETLELQAFKMAQNAILYKGSAPCPQCGVIINPVEYMYSTLGGLCPDCTETRRVKRIQRKMSH